MNRVALIVGCATAMALASTAAPAAVEIIHRTSVVFVAPASRTGPIFCLGGFTAGSTHT